MLHMMFIKNFGAFNYFQDIREFNKVRFGGVIIRKINFA